MKNHDDEAQTGQATCPGSQSQKILIMSVVQPLNLCNSKSSFPDFPGGPVGGTLPVSEGDISSTPGLGRSHMPQSN